MWKKVQLGFDAEDETVNFGTRQMAAFGKSVYETSTLATITKEEKTTNQTEDALQEVPRFHCVKYYGSNPGIIIIVHETVIVLGNDATEIKMKFSFDAAIDSCAIKPDGSLLIIALKNGDVFCFLLLISENPIFLKNVCNANPESSRTFTGLFLHDFGDFCELILTAYSGNIYILRNINVIEIARAYLSDLKENINDVIENIKLDYISINEGEHESSNIVHSVAFKKSNSTKMLVLVGTRKGQELQSWSADLKLKWKSEIEFEEGNYRIQRLQIPKNESLIYGLTDKETVLTICPYTLTALHHLKNIQWVSCENLQEELSSFLVLTNESPAKLQLIEMPMLQVKFQMDVNINTHLAENQSSLDDLIYLEDLTAGNDARNVESVHLKMISETQPEYRLERILRRGKFDEAEQFARRFNLSVTSVYKAHLQKLSNDIQPWATNDVSIEKTGALFKELLQKVDDTEFIAKCSLNALSSDFKLMVDVLKYAESRIKTSLSPSNEECQNREKLQQLYKEIRDTLFKLNTFYLVSEKFFSVDDWLSFSKANLIEECQKYLKQGKLKEVTLIWCRHIPSIRDQLTLDQVTSFFRGIPNSVPSSEILELMKIFLPVVFSKYSEIIANFINWCKDKVNIMELMGEPNWIQTSIEFLKQVLMIVREDVKICDSLNIVECEYSKQSPIKDLLFHVRILTEIAIMKKEHDINISIAEYTQENRRDVIFNILDLVPVEELNSFMLGFFKTLLSQENKNADIIISEYIQNLVETSVNWWYWEEAPWETRVDIMLNHIVGLQEKLNTVLTVLKCSPVPWSATITRICDESLKHDNPTSRLISEQKRMINCKLILKKYDYKDIKLIQPNFRKVVLYIFSQKRDTMLEDALQIAETLDSKLCIEVYKLWIQKLIEGEDVEKVSAFLEDNNSKPNITIACCESVILRTHALSSMPIFSSKLENYINVIDIAYNKLLRTCKTTNSSPLISENVCKQLKNVYYLKKNFTVNVTNSDFTKPKEKDELMNRCLYALLEDVKRDLKNLRKLKVKLKELGNCLEYSTGKISLHFTRLALTDNQFQIVVFMIRLLLNEETFLPDVSKQIIDLSSYILAHFMRNALGDDIPGFMHQLIVQALDSCPLRSIRKGIEFERWFQLMRSSPQLDSSATLTNREIALSCAGSISTSKLVKLLKAYCLYLYIVDPNSLGDYLSEEDLNEIMRNREEFDLIEVLENIVAQENESVAFRLIVSMHCKGVHANMIAEKEIGDSELIAQTITLTNTCMHKLLQKLIVSRNLDTQFGSAILYDFPAEQALQWMMESIKRHKFDFQRLYALTELGLVYFQRIVREDKWNEFYALRKRCTWGKQIAKFGISYKEAFRETPEEQKQLLLKLMSVPSISTTLLAKYCRDMNFSFQTCLKAYLKQTLLSWQPEYEVKISAITGEKEIIMKNTQKCLLNKCLEIISLIENRQELSELISNSIWDSINYYYYEVYLVLLTLMEENIFRPSNAIFSTYRHVFLFLSTYHRIAKPQDYEKEHWCQLHQNTQPLPPISEHRLPFRLIFSKWTKSNSDPWKIITPELTIRTYSKWFTVLDALELDKNTLCSFAVHQMTSEQTLTENSEVKWCIHSRHQKLLADVRTCIDNIDSLEMASASLYYVMNHLPPGADQLMAAKLCFVQAKKWLETEPSEKATAGFNKCYSKYLTISTTHVLYVHELGKPQYLQLVLKPVELIKALYNDPIILERNSGNILLFPDINKAAEEIGKLHRQNLNKIKLDLLEEWLLPENFMVNVSYSECPHRLQDDDLLQDPFSTTDRENFLKACYIVEGDLRTLGPYLVKIVFDQNTDDSKPTYVRIRALRCLFSVTGKDVLEQVIGSTIEKLRDYMSRLEFVTELEILGLTYTMESFTSCNKLEVVKCVLALKNKTAFRLAARICQYFGITSSVVWNNILMEMCLHEMVKDLMEILPSLTNLSHTLDLSCFERSWNMVLITPLKKAPSGPSEDRKKLIEETMKLLRSCPIIDSVDLDTMKEDCSRINSQELIDEINSLTF